MLRPNSLVVLTLCIFSTILNRFSLANTVENTVVDLSSAANVEFRGVWVATVANIDWPSSSRDSVSRQQQDLTTLFDTLQRLNFNAVIFQVRPAGDAFYASSLEPWSMYLTGTQGQAPNPSWDPLATAVELAHQRGMELHAWFNPYRAKSGSTSKTGLASNHMANRFPQYAYPYGNNLWMDPGSDLVINHTVNVISDVITRYDVDGIHFDDYFYPYPVSGQPFPDDATYGHYTASGGKLSRDEWRHYNVDRLIQSAYQRISHDRPWVKFGISPFGIWRSHNPSSVVGFSSDTALYADSRKWLQSGWLDYLAPQLYWRIDPPQQSFTALSDWWIQQNTMNRHIYPGCATYRIQDSHWPISEIQNQVIETRKRNSQADLGNIFFSAKYYVQNTLGISDLFQSQIYQTPALVPGMAWKTSDISGQLDAPHVTLQSGAITWSANHSPKLRGYLLYEDKGGSFHLLRVLGKGSHTASLEPGRYALTAMDRLGRQSFARVFNIDTSIIG